MPQVKDLQNSRPLWIGVLAREGKVYEQALHVMIMQMLQWCLGLTQFDHAMNDDILCQLGIMPNVEKTLEVRFIWYIYIVRDSEDSVGRTAMCLDPGGQQLHGRLKKRWMDCIKEDMKEVGFGAEDIWDQLKWRWLF